MLNTRHAEMLAPPLNTRHRQRTRPCAAPVAVRCAAATLDATDGIDSGREAVVEAPPDAQLPTVRTLWWKWRAQDIRYKQAGEAGPAVVLVHGFGSNADQWPGLAALAKTHRVFALDLLGFGYSSKPDPTGLPPNSVYNFTTWGSQLTDFIRDVVGEPSFLVANSVGGIASLQSAVDAPQHVKGVVLISVSLRGLHVSKQPALARPLIAAFQTALRTTPLGASLFAQIVQPAAVRNVLREAYGNKAAVTDTLVANILGPGNQPGAAAVFLDFISYSSGPLAEDLLPRVSAPVTTIWGEVDPWESCELARNLYSPAAVPGVVQDFVVLRGIGHCPQDEAPDAVNAVVSAFVARHA